MLTENEIINFISEDKASEKKRIHLCMERLLILWIFFGPGALLSLLFTFSSLLFSGIPVNDPSLWAEILGKVGCHAFTKPGFYVRRNSRYLLVYSGKGSTPGWANDVLVGRVDQSGRADVALEDKVKSATDVFTGEVVARDTDRFTLKSEVPRTWLIRME